ncbi:BON domain-containing protein [Accumulibacter sp.]|uniref:BON domain-containing protein n=1 Tax=Accumulibacter sp. TaxID=2053492 RepID=UPI0025D65644|nr:BON domain-containing protein [Accumulibacter sp.]MCM8596569.1 BON domain-containing protein [Accumulibacter sp.]MDS4050717.1 BON domain-containing protein [Accumulibacter sp.]
MNRLSAVGVLLGALVLPVLQGCLPVLAASAATGGAMAAVDRRSLGTQTDDETTEWKASARATEQFGDRAHLNFTSYNRKVLITGEVASPEMKTEIESLVASLPLVQGVYNEVTVGPPTSLTTRSNDAYLTTRVKARFVDSGKFNPVRVKVVTEAGVVYLLGLVTQSEADSAVQVARTTSGVVKVVTLMEIISPAKAREFDGSAPRSDTPPAGSSLSGG